MITTKKAKGKLTLFRGNVERLIPTHRTRDWVQFLPLLYIYF